MKPALSPEEWDEVRERPGYFRGIEHVTDPGRCHKIAASCLYEQEFGFTRDMIRAIHSAMYYLSGSYCPVCESSDVGWAMIEPTICSGCGFRPFPKGEYRALVKAATDNIEALLPPERK